MTLITNESMIFHEIYSIAIATPITVCSCDSHFLITKGEIEFAAKLHPVIFRSKSSGSREESLPNLPTFHTVDPVQEISINASAQKKAVNEIQIAEKKLTEFEQIYNITTDFQFRLDTYKKIGDLRDEIRSNKERIIKLKRNASYSQKCREKKRKILNKNQEVIQYDKPGHPSLLFEHPNLHDHIHDLIKFGAADEKR
ncbi:unnamed protein product [Rhizophagus irregularis]|nr:unnamed protein product [Rhizophagus irregularis]